MYVSPDDVNTHLPTDRLSVEEGSFTSENLEVERVIRGYLSGVFTPATLAAWVSPSTTPEVIRSVAGRLIAALIYSRQLSGEDPELNEYAQDLYNKAMSQLQGIAAGVIVVLDPTTSEPVEDSHSLTETDFWPNSTSPAPFFSVGKQF